MEQMVSSHAVCFDSCNAELHLPCDSGPGVRTWRVDYRRYDKRKLKRRKVVLIRIAARFLLYFTQAAPVPVPL
jgi:hypothetical protein